MTTLPTEGKKRPWGRTAVPCFLCATLICIGLFHRGAVSAGGAESLFTVRATGFSEGTGLTARKLAAEQAQQHVLEEVLQSMTGNSDLSAFHPILRNASKYIRHYDILRTVAVADGTEVEIDAHVLERPLRHDVATLMLPRLPRKPNVLLLIADYVGPEADAEGPTFEVAESSLREKLKEFDFSINGIHTLLDYYEPEQLLGIVNGGVQEGAAFARAAREDVVVVGTARSAVEPLMPESNLLRNRATVSLRVFAGIDGKMTDTVVAEALIQSSDPEAGAVQAVMDACTKVASDCIVAVVLAVLAAGDETRVVIDINVPRAEAAAGPIADILREVPQVISVETLFLSDSLARLGLEYSGPMAVLSDALSGRHLENHVLEVVRCIKREMTITFR